MTDDDHIETRERQKFLLAMLEFFLRHLDIRGDSKDQVYGQPINRSMRLYIDLVEPKRIKQKDRL